MTTIIQTLKTLTLAAILSFGISFAYAWTAPTTAPTGGNTSAPLNTSSTDQTKVGGVTFGGNIGANAMAISNAAANALQVAGGATFGGNVGIGTGTTAPGAKLHVAGGNIYSDGDLYIGTAGAQKSIWLDGGYGTRITAGINRAPIQFYVNDAERVRFDANGNVGIGTTNPASGYKLDVAGSTNIGANLKVDGKLYGSGAQGPYGSLSIEGSKNTWAGLNFPGSGTLMMHPSYSGFYNAADNGWRWLVDNAGNVTNYGSLDVSQGLSATSGSFGSVCINSDCRSSWPSSTTYTAGTGISISGTTITNTGITSLTAGTGINISGTTITNTGDTNTSDDITSLSAGQGISISGTGNSRTINSKFQCRCDAANGAPVTCGVAYATASLPSGFFRTGGGCSQSVANERQIVISMPADTSRWYCSSTDEDNCKAGVVTAYVCGCSTN